MSRNGSQRGLSRRQLLSIMAGTAYLSTQGPLLQAAPAACTAHSHAMTKAAVLPPPSPGIFNQHQFDTIATLAEIIIPADDHSPGAKAAGVAPFIAEIVAVSEDTVQKLWLEGLKALDGRSQKMFGKSFLDTNAEQQKQVVTLISQHEEHPETLEDQFFKAAKLATIDGYYNSAIGIHQDLQYQGNTVLAEFPGCVHEIHADPSKPAQ
ncbi:MAG: gluconate 2-dehydrogenase subunit 3 family protein [Terriglobia bacterium]